MAIPTKSPFTVSIDDYQKVFSNSVTTLRSHQDSELYAGAPSYIDGDHIRIDGVPLRQILNGIYNQLSVLAPSMHLHSDYKELKELYDAYNTKLAEIQEKIKMWDHLKK